MLNLLRKAKNQKGFTLVELMVVVVIIGILVAIAVPVYNNIQGTAAEKAHKANIRTIQSAVMMYQTENDTSNTPSINDLVPDFLAEWPEAPKGQDRSDYLDYVSDTTYPAP